MYLYLNFKRCQALKKLSVVRMSSSGHQQDGLKSDLLHPSFHFSLSKESDAIDLVAYANHIGGETNFLTFGQNEFHLTVDQEKQFISDLDHNKNGLLLITRLKESGEVISCGTSISEGRRYHLDCFVIL